MNKGVTFVRFARAVCLVVAALASTGPAVGQDARPGLNLTEPEKAFIKSNPTLTLCVDPDWLPYEGLSADGKHVGLISEYALELQTRTGLQFELVKTASWEESWQLVEAGECDIVAGLNRTRAREEYLSFTEEYINEPKVLVTQTGRGDIKSLPDLQGKSIGLVKGYSLDEKLGLDYPKINRVYVSSLRDGLAKLSKGEVDGVVGAKFLMETAIADGGYTNLQIVSETRYLNLVRVGLRRDYYRGFTIMNKAVNSLSYADHKAIRESYLAAASMR
ncbi:MAG: transporter substrate-binding domain-containing protein [Chromatiales bacterium]|nr:MAG: transporter substrate-binding domain-containing protein [Chromatiales bacterium]